MGVVYRQASNVNDRVATIRACSDYRPRGPYSVLIHLVGESVTRDPFARFGAAGGTARISGLEAGPKDGMWLEENVIGCCALGNVKKEKQEAILR